jgi:protein-S-isoprenylcysteine O-methyltransferase Ste14
VVLLPVEWLLPPSLIALRVGEIEADWPPLRVVGLAVGLAGAVLLVWASVLLGRLMIHEAAVREDHALVESGPYRFVRHPVYAGYLALLLRSGVASLNVCLWLLWPVSLLGIRIQAASEEQLLRERFGQEYERYVRRTGRLVPRFWGQDADPDTAADESMGGFPPAAVNDAESHWYCPAFGQVIDHGLCWECCFAGIIGPRDTKEYLIRWIKESGRFASLEEFHQVCESCEHCQWSREPESGRAESGGTADLGG